MAAVAAIGLAAYQIGTSPTEEKIIQSTESEEFAMLEDDVAENEDLGNGNLENGNLGEDFYDDLDDAEETDAQIYEEGNSDEEEASYDSELGAYESGMDENDSLSTMSIPGENGSSADGETVVTSGSVDSTGLTEEASVNSNLIDIEVPEEDWESVDTASQSMLQQLHFSEAAETEWPTYGTILLDYNMTQTVYFPTLDQYKLSPAIVVQAEEGTPVLAAASGMVYDISQNVQTGTTVTMELGDGYQAIYGQLKDLTVEEGEMIEKGTVIGYVNAPTKYYSVEGSNLYFAMKQNGEYVDPKAFLPE